MYTTIIFTYLLANTVEKEGERERRLWQKRIKKCKLNQCKSKCLFFIISNYRFSINFFGSPGEYINLIQTSILQNKSYLQTWSRWEGEGVIPVIPILITLSPRWNFGLWPRLWTMPHLWDYKFPIHWYRIEKDKNHQQ